MSETILEEDKKLPPLTQQMVHFVDGTPDQYYAIRILKAYKENCNCKWATSVTGECDNPLWVAMNEMQDQRAVLLDEAIAILEKAL